MDTTGVGGGASPRAQEGITSGRSATEPSKQAACFEIVNAILGYAACAAVAASTAVVASAVGASAVGAKYSGRAQI